MMIDPEKMSAAALLGMVAVRVITHGQPTPTNLAAVRHTLRALLVLADAAPPSDDPAERDMVATYRRVAECLDDLPVDAPSDRIASVFVVCGGAVAAAVLRNMDHIRAQAATFTTATPEQIEAAASRRRPARH